MAKIEVKDLSFKYPLADKPALKNISFQVNPSEFIVVCGKSGCGKSTLLRHLKNSMTPYGIRTGEILYGGIPMEDLDQRRSTSEIGFVQQNPDNQLVTDKVWHELAFGLENLGLPNKTIKRRVAEMTGYFGIQGWFRRDVSTLSGGQKQLLNLASVMVMQPEILILDEPASQLDPIAAEDFLQTIYRINRDLGTTIIISEHCLENVFPMADRVMVMDKGEIIAFDSPARIGHHLADFDNGMCHPMYYGMPSVMRIFQPMCVSNENSPLTIREGRIKLEEVIEGHPELLEDIPAAHTLPDNKTNTKETSGKDILSLKNLWFRYNKESGDVLRGLSLKVKEGTWHCLLGGNGTGKSTTLKLISGIMKAQRGSVVVDGIKVGSAGYEDKLFDRCLAFLPQNPQALFTEITVEEELFEGMLTLSLSDEEKVHNVEKMLELMEITHLRKANPYDLSGGEQQRLALGKILLLEPRVLLLDEPTKGLDPFFKITLAGILRKLVDAGVTIFMVSHDIEFCAQYADRCSMFFDGEIVSEETPKNFFAGNSFYTTAANKVTRKWRTDLVTCEEVSQWIQTEEN
ncbi:MAG: energy-coupling factor transporter ATPase [Eubacteriaceae bacterium]|nr:energy-coupling factor transporter ATPase [Eubacteriaceae bacterium]